VPTKKATVATKKTSTTTKKATPVKASATKSATAKSTAKTATKTTTKSTAKKSASANIYAENGLKISPVSYSKGDKIKITYTGLLPSSGATEVYAHYGWGKNWTNQKEVKMTKGRSGFSATIEVTNAGSLNICFKDACDNWDNNSGANYIL